MYNHLRLNQFLLKGFLFLILLIYITSDVNSQIYSSSFHIHNELDNFSISQHVASRGKVDNKIAQYIFSGNNSLLRKVAIVDQMIEQDYEIRTTLRLLEHYQEQQRIAETNDLILIKNLLVATKDIKTAFFQTKTLNIKKTDIIAFLVFKYIEVNYYELLDDSDAQFCTIYKDVIATYNISNTNFENPNVKELLYDPLLDYDYSCSDEELMLINSIEREKYVSSSKNEFKLKAVNGVYKIPIIINESLKIDFIYDSGASDILIPLDVFKTLVRMDKIKSSDLRSVKNYIIADGTTIESQTFIIRSLKLGDIEVNDVLASVGPIESELLLGQSFQKRFKEVRIDNRTSTLIVIK
ncbi:MAG: putative aspartyl protease [Halioglobus sp.]|jgi:predicted aspartyl protease